MRGRSINKTAFLFVVVFAQFVERAEGAADDSHRDQRGTRRRSVVVTLSRDEDVLGRFRSIHDDFRFDNRPQVCRCRRCSRRRPTRSCSPHRKSARNSRNKFLKPETSKYFKSEPTNKRMQQRTKFPKHMPDFSVSVVGCQLRKTSTTSSTATNATSGLSSSSLSTAMPAVLTSSSSSAFGTVIVYEVLVKTGSSTFIVVVSLQQQIFINVRFVLSSCSE